MTFNQKMFIAKKMCEGYYVKETFYSIYPFTTENISGYINNFNLNNKSLLTLGSSGDQVINASIIGCKDISVLDICPFSKYYFYLKKASILSLTYQEFLYFFCYRDFPKTFVNNNEAFNKKTFLKLKETLKALDNESFVFWNNLYDLFSPITVRKELFSYDEYKIKILSNLNLYLNNESSFYECKNKLKNINPKFITGDIRNVKLNRDYDNIWLSNLGLYLGTKDLKKLVDKLFNNLDNEGKMLICYLYNTIRTTKYIEGWEEIYNLDEVFKIFKFYSPKLNSFIGVDGILHEWKKSKDSVLVYNRKSTY